MTIGYSVGICVFSFLFVLCADISGASVRLKTGLMTAGNLVVIFSALSIGVRSLGIIRLALKSFHKASTTAPRILDAIEALPNIDSIDSDDGEIISAEELRGRITFDAVKFEYTNCQASDTSSSDENGNGISDSRDDIEKNTVRKKPNDASGHKPVLYELSFDIPAGSSKTLFSHSGSRKSTVPHLIQRLYDPLEGRVLLDGYDIRTLNVRWLRSQIGIVSQTPFLFMLSVRDNIALGSAPSFSRDTASPVILVKE